MKSGASRSGESLSGWREAQNKNEPASEIR
jgi:hypothetical protein